jgi:amino acid transporter
LFYLGIICATTAGFLSINFLAETTSIGTLFAFIMVCLSVIIIHWAHKLQENIENTSDLIDSNQTLPM